MGLCKCPKKNVTNQFCYEHRVNVCEHCMISNHAKCVVQSYHLWLRDSDYDPVCMLCKTDLAKEECIRLICYHVFHWECLNKYASELSPNTAPAGYTCPKCQEVIFPPSNMASPLAEVLRNKLLGVNWARCGLAFPIIEEKSSSQQPQHTNSIQSSPKKSAFAAAVENISRPSETSSQYIAAKPVHTHSVDVSRSSRPEPYGAAFTSGNFAAPRKMYDTTENIRFRPSVVDHDEDKYKRRSALEWVRRWFQSKTFHRTQKRDPNIFYKRWVVLGMLALIALCTVSILFLRMGRASADTDPLLDPHLNPNIRVQDSVDGGAVQEAAQVIDKDNALPLNNDVQHIRPR